MSDNKDRQGVALTDRQIRDIAARFQAMPNDDDGFVSFYSTNLERFVREILRASSSRAEVEIHPDDIAVDRFAAAMKAKMAASRDKGRSGWDNPEQCDPESLAEMLIEHLYKGDPVDVGNFAMMLFNRPDAGGALAAAAPRAQCRDIAGALFDFGGYLTSREDRITVSARDLATPMVEALRIWAEKRGLPLDPADVMRWNSMLAAAEAPKEKGK